MNSLQTLARPASLLAASTVLNRQGFTCTVLTFAPDSETRLPFSTSADDQLLYVLEGDIALHAEGITTIVNRGDAHLLAAGRTPVISACANTPARVLRVEIPPRQVITPQLLTPRA